MSSGWAVVVLAVAGAARVSQGVASPRVQLASLYAPLFQPGRTWRYRVERMVEYQDPDKPVDAGPTIKKDVSEATCRVARLEEIRKLERVADRWCRTDGVSSGDQYSDTLCFGNGDGLSFGTRQFSGGEFREVRFCLRPRDCRALGR